MSRDATGGDPARERGRGETEITVYGRRSVLEALAATSVEVEGIRVAREAPPGFRAELTAACRGRGLRPEVVPRAEVERISGDARNDQGVVARVRLLGVSGVEAFVDSLKGAAAKTPSRVMALDGVTNPQNIGMIVRSVVASGMTAMLWPLTGCPWVSGLIIKSSAASVYRCPIVRCATLAEGLWSLKAAGFRLYTLEPWAAASLFECAPAHRSVFIVGGEASGVSAEIGGLADERVSIPMRGGVESLNVAVAASLVCFRVAGRGG